MQDEFLLTDGKRQTKWSDVETWPCLLLLLVGGVVGIGMGINHRGHRVHRADRSQPVQVVVVLGRHHLGHATRCEHNIAHQRGVGKVGIRRAVRAVGDDA